MAFLANLLCVLLSTSFSFNPKNSHEIPQYDSSSEIVGGACPKGEHYNPCLLNCQRNCSNWPYPCLGDCTPGCVCDLGTLKAANGRCIKLEECPKEEEEDIPRDNTQTIPGEAALSQQHFGYCPDDDECLDECRKLGYKNGYCASRWNCFCYGW